MNKKLPLKPKCPVRYRFYSPEVISLRTCSSPENFMGNPVLKSVRMGQHPCSDMLRFIFPAFPFRIATVVNMRVPSKVPTYRGTKLGCAIVLRRESSTLDLDCSIAVTLDGPSCEFHGPMSSIVLPLVVYVTN